MPTKFIGRYSLWALWEHSRGNLCMSGELRRRIPEEVLAELTLKGGEEAH